MQTASTGCSRRAAAAVAQLALTTTILSLSSLDYVLAQPNPNGEQFQVNDYTSFHQGFAAVAVASDSSFVVVWESYGSNGTDNSGKSIQARRFDQNGAALGAQFQVNSYTSGYQSYPSVATDSEGGFVVAWMSYGSPGSDSDGYSVQARRYSASGYPISDQFQVNSYTMDGQIVPSLAVDPGGGFVVSWESYGSPESDVSGTSVQARRFDAVGTPLGDQFQVNAYTTSSQGRPVIAGAPGGGFIVAWQSSGSEGTDSHYRSIQARRFDALGVPLGDQFQVNTSTVGNQDHPAIGGQGPVGFIIAWKSDESAGTDSDGESIQAQRFDAVGSPLGSEFQVNAYTTGSQAHPGVAMDPLGGFIVTWHSFGSSGSDTSRSSVQTRQFLAGGTPLADDFQVNTYTSADQSEPAVSADGGGNVVVTWTSVGSPGTDQESGSIQARRFDQLFRDGFESGDTMRWSAASP